MFPKGVVKIKFTFAIPNIFVLGFFCVYVIYWFCCGFFGLGFFVFVVFFPKRFLFV